MFSKKNKKEQNPNQRAETQESEFTNDRETLLNRNLALSYYAHASHLDKLGHPDQALTDALNSRSYMSKVPNESKDETLRNIIEKKIDKLRTLVNNEKVFQENDMLLKSRAEMNFSKIRSANSVDIAKELNENPSYYHPKVKPSQQNKKEKAKFDSKSNMAIKNTSVVESKQASQHDRSIKQRDAMPSVINKNTKLTGYNKITKDPYAKINYDSLRFRVTPLYLHNEFFYGNYSNGVEMYRSTCNNRKYFPYEQLNPVPNDPNFTQKQKPAQLKQSRSVYRHEEDRLRGSATEKKAARTNDEDADLNEGLNEVLDDSFNSNPPEVIELNSPPAELKTKPLSIKSKGRTQSAVEKISNQESHTMKRPQTALSPSPNDDHDDSLPVTYKQKPRSRESRSIRAGD